MYKHRTFGRIAMIILALCSCGCETSKHFVWLAPNVAGDEFQALYATYSYHELVGAHTGMIGDQRFYLYRIDLSGGNKFGGKPSEMTELKLDGSFAAGSEEAVLVGDAPLIVGMEYVGYNHYLIRTWDIRANREVAKPFRIPGNTKFYNTSTFSSPDSLHAFTASGRWLIVQNAGVTSVRDMLHASSVDVPGLGDLITRCAALCRTSSEQVDPMFTEDLRYLLVVPPDLGAMGRHQSFVLDGISYSFADNGYYGERNSSGLRPFPMRHDGKTFVAAESDQGVLMLLYQDANELLVRSADGSFEARVSTLGPTSSVTRFGVTRFTRWPTMWREERIIFQGPENRLNVWHYRSGNKRVVEVPEVGE